MLILNERQVRSIRIKITLDNLQFRNLIHIIRKKKTCAKEGLEYE